MASFQEVHTRTATKTTKAFEAGIASLIDDKVPVTELLSGPIELGSLSMQQRRGLLRGPKTQVLNNGNIIFHDAPVRALMATSTTANEHFRLNPKAKQFEVSTDPATKGTLKRLLIHTITDQAIGGAKVLRVPGGATMKQSIELYKAGFYLGMSERVEHIAKYLMVAISHELIGYEELNAITAGLTPSDRLFQHVAKDLAQRRFQKSIPDPAEFEDWLDKRTQLKQAMAQIDAEHKTARQHARKAYSLYKEANVRVEAEQARRKQQRADREYHARVRALTKKLNEAKGGFLSLTYEEGELRRELGI